MSAPERMVRSGPPAGTSGARMRHVLATGLMLAVLALAGTGCLIPGLSSAPSISVRATFTDVANLVPGAPVQYADVTVGQVSSITLSGSSAKVVMSIQKSANVPANVQANVAQATILGEEVIQLVQLPSGRPAGARLLADGATITRTLAVPGVEQLVKAGTAVFGAVGTQQLAGMIEAGAQGFGGEGQTLHRLLADLNTVSGAYASRDKEITALISSLHELGASLAPNARSNGDAIGNLARATTVLADNSQRFETLLGALNQLAVQGRAILETYLPGINLQLRGLDRVTSALADRQLQLALLLHYLPVHNSVLHGVIVNNFLQIVNDLIVCGLPGGGSNAQAVNTCAPGGG